MSSASVKAELDNTELSGIMLAVSKSLVVFDVLKITQLNTVNPRSIAMLKRIVFVFAAVFAGVAQAHDFPTWEELFRGGFYTQLGRDAERILLGGVPYYARPFHGSAYPPGYIHPDGCRRGYACIPAVRPAPRIEHRRIEVASERVATSSSTATTERLPTLDEAVAKATAALGGKPTDGRRYLGVRTLSRVDEVPECSPGVPAKKIKKVDVQGFELERWFCPS